MEKLMYLHLVFMGMLINSCYSFGIYEASCVKVFQTLDDKQNIVDHFKSTKDCKNLKEVKLFTIIKQFMGCWHGGALYSLFNDIEHFPSSTVMLHSGFAVTQNNTSVYVGTGYYFDTSLSKNSILLRERSYVIQMQSNISDILSFGSKIIFDNNGFSQLLAILYMNRSMIFIKDICIHAGFAIFNSENSKIYGLCVGISFIGI